MCLERTVVRIKAGVGHVRLVFMNVYKIQCRRLVSRTIFAVDDLCEGDFREGFVADLGYFGRIVQHLLTIRLTF